MTEGGGGAARVGETLAGKYRILRFVGEGGMGAVYEAQHEVVGRRFAVKFLHSDLARVPEALDRFKREAQAAGSLENDHIASVVDFGHTGDGIPYIVMEFLAGEDLGRFLAREGPLPVARAVDIIIQACRGLAAAHTAGIVHRDLKPENLFVCRRADGADLIKVLDFGIAKLAPAVIDGTLPAMTPTGTVMGTPFYMPPEQARGAKDLDHRADIYALGVILYEALTGQKPHPGDSYNAILYHILTQPPTPIATLRPGLPGDLVELVHGALSSEPDQRPASAVEFARALSRHAGVQLTPQQSQFNLRVAVEADRSASGPGRRYRVPIIVAAALVVAATAAVLLVRGERNEAAAPATADAVSGAAPPAPAAAPAAPIIAPAPVPDAAPPALDVASGSAPAPSPPPRPKAPNDERQRKAPRRPVFDRSNPYQ